MRHRLLYLYFLTRQTFDFLFKFILAMRAGRQMLSAGDSNRKFKRLSSVLTGYPEIELDGTGQLVPFMEVLGSALGAASLSRFLDQSDDAIAACTSRDASEAQLFPLMQDEFFGEIARRVIKLWYLGIWTPLDGAWYDRHAPGQSGPPASEILVSSAAYLESLVWDAVGAHPMAGKPPGFGTWGLPPE